MKKNLTAAALIVALLAAPSSLVAQPSPAPATPTTGASLDASEKAERYQASQYEKSAKKDFEQKRYARALGKLRQAYGIVRRPETGLMIVRSLRALGRDLEAYREALALEGEVRALVERTGGEHQSEHSRVEALLAELSEEVALVTVSPVGPEGSTVKVNGEPLAPAEWGGPVAVEPGPVVVVLTTPEGTFTEKATAKVGERVDMAISPPVEPPVVEPSPSLAPPPPTSEQGAYAGPDRLTLGIIAGSLGVVGMVNFGIFGVLSNGQLDRLESACPERASCDPRLEQEAQKGQRYQTAANVSLGLGVAFLAAGAGFVLWDLFDPGGERPGAQSVHLTLGPGAAFLRGSF